MRTRNGALMRYPYDWIIYSLLAWAIGLFTFILDLFYAMQILHQGRMQLGSFFTTDCEFRNRITYIGAAIKFPAAIVSPLP